MLIILYSQKRKPKIGLLTSGATSFLNPGQETVGVKLKWHCCHCDCGWPWGPRTVPSLAVGGRHWCHPRSSLPLSSFPLYVFAESLEGEHFCKKPRGSSTYFCKRGVLRPGNSLPTLSSFWGSWGHLSHDVCNIQHQHLLDTYCIPGYEDP